MATDETFDMFHKYNRLVRRQLAKPLSCNVCGSQYTTSLGKEDQLVLICFGCDSEVVPGEALLGTVRAVVKEHFL